jgi:hypothetical protein
MDISERNRLLHLMEEYYSLLMGNNGQHLTPGIREIIAVLSDSTLDNNQVFREVKPIYKRIKGGMGTLGDFMITHPDKETDKILNKKLINIEQGIWDILSID